MTQWEYQAILRELRNAYWTVEMTEEVARMGGRGWELVAAYPVEYEVRMDASGRQKMTELRERWVFKRPIVSEPGGASEPARTSRGAS